MLTRKHQLSLAIDYPKYWVYFLFSWKRNDFSIKEQLARLKEVVKLYFMHSSSVVIILFNTDLYRSAFFIIILIKNNFLSFCVLFFAY